MDLVRGHVDCGHGCIVVEEVNDGGQELAHICNEDIFLVLDFIAHIGQVSGNNCIKEALFVALIELAHAIREQSEGGADEYSLGPHVLKLHGSVDHAGTGGDHIIDDDDILAGYIGS